MISQRTYASSDGLSLTMWWDLGKTARRGWQAISPLRKISRLAHVYWTSVSWHNTSVAIQCLLVPTCRISCTITRGGSIFQLNVQLRVSSDKGLSQGVDIPCESIGSEIAWNLLVGAIYLASSASIFIYDFSVNPCRMLTIVMTVDQVVYKW